MKFSILTFASVLAATKAEDITLPWSVQAYADEVVDVGDTITFEFTSGHNVYIHPTGTCDPEGSILVGETGPVTYTFSEEDAGESLFFTCQVGSHCELDQHVTVSVQQAESPIGPEGPDDPVGPEVPGEPVDPEVPGEPVEPEGPGGPVDPEGPGESLGPEGPQETIDPIEPEDPEEPVEPGEDIDDGDDADDMDMSEPPSMATDPIDGDTTEEPETTEAPAGADSLPPTVDDGMAGNDWDVDMDMDMDMDRNTTDPDMNMTDPDMDDEDEDEDSNGGFGFFDEDGATSLQLGFVGALATFAFAIL